MKFLHGCLMALVMLSSVQADEPAPKSPKVETKVATQELELTAAESNLLQFVNAERARHGLPPLKIDTALLVTTRRHAGWMATNRTMRHAAQVVGEIIAMGQPTSDAALRTWLNSPPHRGHVLSRSWTRCGVAGYMSPEGRLYWCMQFLR